MKKRNLQSSKVQSPNPVQFSSKTPEKLSQRNRTCGVALSVADIKEVGKGLQNRKRHCETTSSPPPSKSVRRQILQWSSPSKSKSTNDDPYKLPEKYEILDQFFDRLDTLISMFRLKGKTPSFMEISHRIESLTDRFTHGHLAQLKFILPDAIVLKKFLVHDERTSCMKQDIHISLAPEAVESDVKMPPQRGRVSLRKLFYARLREFWESHPEGDEIPEGTLPEPFNRPKNVNILDTSETRLPTKLSLCMRYNDIVNNVESASIDANMSAPVETSIELPNERLAAASHIAPFFRARFSLKLQQNLADTVQQISQVDSVQPSPAEWASQAASSENYSRICASLESSSAPAPTSTPSKTVDYTENEDASSLERIDAMSTPAKLVSTPIRLMSATPALRSPERYLMSPDDHPTNSLNKLARRPTRSRSLRFDSPVKNEEVVNEDNAGGLPIDDDVFDILPGKLVQSGIVRSPKG